MAIEIGISSDSDAYLFMTSESNTGRPVVRVQPHFMHVAPVGSRSGTARGIVYASLPMRLTKEDWIDYAPTKAVASKYSVYARDDSTTIIHVSYIGGENEASYLKLYALHDFKTAFSSALLSRIDSRYRHDLPFPLNGLSWDRIESYCRASWDRWMIPAFDVCDNQEPVWLANRKVLDRKFDLRSSSVSELDVIESVEKAINLIPRAGKPKKVWTDPERRCEQLDFVYIGSADDLAEPELEDFSDAEGMTFEFDDRQWTVTECFPPISSDEGWLFEVESEDGFVSGLNEGDVRRIRMNDSASIRPLWTSMHRRYFYKSRLSGKKPGQKVKSREYRDGDYYISFYRVVEDNGSIHFELIERYTVSEWKAKKMMSKLKEQHERNRKNTMAFLSKKLQETRKADKMREEQRKKVSMKADEALRKLSRLQNGKEN